MNNEQLRQNADAMLAFADGQAVQLRRLLRGELWSAPTQSNVSLEWRFDLFEYRRNPLPKTRQWNCSDDVPGPVCFIKLKDASSYRHLVVNVDNSGIMSASGYHYKWHELESYSTDRKKWLPCVVTEE